MTSCFDIFPQQQQQQQSNLNTNQWFVGHVLFVQVSYLDQGHGLVGIIGNCN
jgi:hypothetical protein